MKEIYQNLNITTTEEFKDKDKLINGDILNKYDLIIISECLEIDKVYKLNDYIRERKN